MRSIGFDTFDDAPPIDSIDYDVIRELEASNIMPINAPTTSVEPFKLDNSSNLYKNILQEAKMQKPTKNLYHNFFYENEITGIFGDSGIGKSILAVQLANQFSIDDAVLYFDFEMSARGLLKRYPNIEEFNDNFYVKFGDDVFQETNIFDSDYIEKDIIKFQPRIIFIDNVTALLSPGKNLQTVEEILNLIRGLKKLKAKYDVTFCLLGHTVKTQENAPLSRNSIAGSKTLINLLDSIVMMGMVGDLRYLKHLKARNGELYSECLKLELMTDGNLEFFESGWELEDDILKGLVKDDSQKYSDIAKYVFSTTRELRRIDITRLIMEKFQYKDKNADRLVSKMIKDEIIEKLENGKYSLYKNAPF